MMGWLGDKFSWYRVVGGMDFGSLFKPGMSLAGMTGGVGSWKLESRCSFPKYFGINFD